MGGATFFVGIRENFPVDVVERANSSFGIRDNSSVDIGGGTNWVGGGPHSSSGLEEIPFDVGGGPTGQVGGAKFCGRERVKTSSLQQPPLCNTTYISLSF